MKNKTARITIIKRRAGLILLPDDDGDEGEEGGSFWKVPVDGGDKYEGRRGGGYVK